MSNDEFVRAVEPGGDPPDPEWGSGLGIQRFGDLDVDRGPHPEDMEVVHVGPFLRWLERLIVSRGHHGAMVDVGWGESEERRLHRWRFTNSHPWVPANNVEDALNSAGLRLVDLYPETDIGDVKTTWCPTCRDEVIVDAGLVCPWCDTVTERSVTQTLHHRTRGRIEYTLTPEQRAESARKRSSKARYLTDDDLKLARALYQDERLTMKHVALRMWQRDRGRRYASPERLEEALRRAFRRYGYATRTTRESNKGVLFRGALCQGTTSKGKPCCQSAARGSRYCFNHDPDRAIERKRRAHMEKMRVQRKWVGKQVPMKPFVGWLQRRKRELALPAGERRFQGPRRESDPTQRRDRYRPVHAHQVDALRKQQGQAEAPDYTRQGERNPGP